MIERALCAQERAHMRAACLLQTRALSSILHVYKSNLRGSPYRRNLGVINS